MKVPGFSRSRQSSAGTTPIPSPCPSPGLSKQRSIQHPSPEEPQNAVGLSVTLSLNGSECSSKDFSPEITESSLSPRLLTPSSLCGRRTASPIVGNRSSLLTASSSKHKEKSGCLFPQVTAEMEQAFAQFDANGDGQISAEELRCVLVSLGDNVNQEEACLMVAEADLDGDGFISFEEFCDLNTKVLQVGEVQSEDELCAAFNVFDLNRNGHITAEELHSVLFKLGDVSVTVEDCNKMIRALDRKGAGACGF